MVYIIHGIYVAEKRLQFTRYIYVAWKLYMYYMYSISNAKVH